MTNKSIVKDPNGEQRKDDLDEIHISCRNSEEDKNKELLNDCSSREHRDLDYTNKETTKMTREKSAGLKLEK